MEKFGDPVEVLGSREAHTIKLRISQRFAQVPNAGAGDNIAWWYVILCQRS